MFTNGPFVVGCSPQEFPLDLRESNWKFFLEPDLPPDAFILTKDGEFVDCHNQYVIRGSPVLFNHLLHVGPNPLVIVMKELTRTQVEAFLWYQYSGNTDKILESPETSLMILKEAERFQVRSMWDDTISALFVKNPDYFESDSAGEFKYYLKTCSRRQEFYPRELANKLFRCLKSSATRFCLSTYTGIWRDDHSPSIDDIPRGQFQMRGKINITMFDKDGNTENAVLSKISNGNVESQRMMNQVRLWFRKREWRVKITAQNKFTNTPGDQSTQGFCATGRWALSVELRSTDFYYQPRIPGQKYIKKETIRIPAEIQVELHIGQHNVLFSDMIQTICEGRDGRFHQNCKLTSAEIINQLRTMSKSQIGITVFATHRNIQPNTHMTLHDTMEVIESQWKVFMDQKSTDLTIQAKDGDLIHCHRSHFARYSHLLRWSNEVVFEMRELTRAQVEAFLRYQYCRSTDKIVESPLTSLLVLKQAERYKVHDMWNDTIKALLLKNSDWFQGDVLLDFKHYWDTCSKKFEKVSDQLLLSYSLTYKKLSGLLEQASKQQSETAHKDASNSSESEDASNSSEREDASNSSEREDASNSSEREDASNSSEREDASNSSEREDASNSSEREDSSNSSESVKKAADNFDMNAIDKEPEQGPSHKSHTPDTMSNMKDITEIDKILGSSVTVLTVLKLVEYKKHDRTWANIISVLLLKDSGWFEGNSEELITFLASCSKQNEEATQILVLKLSRLQEKSNKTKEEKEGDNQDIGHTAVTTEDANQIEEIDRDQPTDEDMATQAEPKKLPNKCNSSSLVEDSCETVSTSTESVPNVRRSSRLQVQKPAPVKKRGLQLDESWQNALERAAKRKKPGKVVYGPRDIRKDPTLPKIAIFPGPELKVEKVEPSEEWSEETIVTDTDENQHQINLQDPDSSTDAACLFGFVKLENESP